MVCLKKESSHLLFVTKEGFVVGGEGYTYWRTKVSSTTPVVNNVHRLSLLIKTNKLTADFYDWDWLRDGERREPRA